MREQADKKKLLSLESDCSNTEKTEVENRPNLQSLKSDYSNIEKTEVESRPKFEAIKSNFKSRGQNNREKVRK